MTTRTAAKPKPGASGKPAAVRAPAPEAALTDQSEVTGSLRLDEIKPCPFNVRRHFDDADLAGLADSIKTVGLKDRLLVRPVAEAGKTAAFAGGKWQHVSHFELVDGERRFRALKIVHESHQVEKVPVTVRQMTDDQVRGIMLASREQSRELSVSDLVAGYAELRANLPDDAALAAIVGQTAGHVRSVLRLGRLPKWALSAVDAGTLPRATAELVARVPGEESRQRAAACAILGLLNPRDLGDNEKAWTTWCQGETHGGSRIVENPLTYRDTKALIANHFQKQLKGAPFSRKELYILPGCEPGHERHIQSCDECPKLAANDPESVAEGTRGDVCLDPDCFAQKVAAYRAKEVAKAAAKGIEEADLGGLASYSNGRPPRGWCDVSELVGATELADDFKGHKRGGEKLKDLFAKPLIACPQYIAFGTGGKAVTLVKTGEARRLLQAGGVLKKPEPRKKAEKPAAQPVANGKPAAKPSGPSTFDVENRTATVAADRCRTMLLANAESLEEMSKQGGPDTDAVYQALALSARVLGYDWLEYGDDRREVVKRFVPEAAALNKDKDRYAVDKAVGAMTPAEVVGFILAMTTHVAGTNAHHWGKGLYQEFLEYADTNEHDCEQQARRELTGEPAEAASVVHCAKCKATFDAAGRNRCPSCGLEVAAPAPTPESVVLLADIDGFPDAVFDKCFHAGITSLPTLLERMAVEQPVCAQLPLRNWLVTYFVGKLDVKMKAAENAADAVAAKVGEPTGEQPEKEPAPAAAPVTGTQLDSVSGFPADAVELLLAKHQISTIEQLKFKQAEYGKQPGRGGISLYGVLRELNCPEKLVYPAGDALTDFLADQLEAKGMAAQAAKPAAKSKKKAGAK